MKEFAWEEIENLARKSRSIRSMINIEDLTFASGSMDKPGLCKDREQEIPGTIGETSYVVLTSLARTVNKYLLDLEEFMSTRIDDLYMIDGGVYNSFLCQFISNTTGIVVHAGPAEAASVGNLIMQLKASGEIKDILEGRQMVSNSINIKDYLGRIRNTGMRVTIILKWS